MTATNHDDQLGEIYPTMLNELNCTFGVSFSRFSLDSFFGPTMCDICNARTVPAVYSLGNKYYFGH